MSAESELLKANSLTGNANSIKGVGVGLRFPHFDEILRGQPQIPWFEVVADDFLNKGPHHHKLAKLRENYPVAFHSLGLNLGGIDDFNKSYLKSLRELHERFEPRWISDHLCWSSYAGNYHHDLLPIPRTLEGIKNICCRIHFLQDYFGRQLVLENITSYLEYKNSEFSEIDFIRQIVEDTGCALLLDISNVIINHKNRGKDYREYFLKFPLEHVKYIHLAGGGYDGKLIIDTHGSEVQNEDINTLKNIYRKGFTRPVIIERDTDLPPFSSLKITRQMGKTLSLEEERKNIETKLYEL